MKLNIRLKLLVGFTVILLLSTLVLGSAYIITRHSITAQIEMSQKQQVKNGANEVKQFFRELQNDGRDLSAVYQTDREKFAPSALYVIKNNDYIKKITVLSPAGKELLKFDSIGQASPEELTYEVLSEPFYTTLSNTTAISKVYYVKEGSGPYMDMFSPILGTNNTIEGVLKTQVNLNLLRSALKDIHLGENGYIHIVDNEGRLLAHPNEAYVLQRPNLSSRAIISDVQKKLTSRVAYQYVNENNTPVIAVAEQVPGYNWIAVFEQPETEAFGFLDMIRNMFAATVIGSFICLLVVALVLSENLTKPIRKLQQSAKQVEKGQRNRIEIVKSGDEIESLSYSFASLINQLFEREHSLRNITMQLEKANAKLKQLDALKNEFVSVASHELRTPMTSIKSYLWMALDGKGGALNAEQRFYVQRGYDSVDRLIRLVNDLLNISRIEAGKIIVEMQKVDLQDLAQSVIGEIYSRANEVGVSISLDKQSPAPEVLADPDKIKEVFFNLLGNSLKFTPRGGNITVMFTEKDGFIETHITDTGEGIAEEDIKKLFQKFGLVPGSYTTNQPVNGTGLGLYICRSIVELHQGKIWVTSKGAGKGTTFSFQLKKFTDEALESFNQKETEKNNLNALEHNES